MIIIPDITIRMQNFNTQRNTQDIVPSKNTNNRMAKKKSNELLPNMKHKNMYIRNKLLKKFSAEKSCDTQVDFNCCYLTKYIKFNIKLY